MPRDVTSNRLLENRLLLLSSIDIAKRKFITVAPNLTVAEIVDIALIGLPKSARSKVRVTIGQHVIERQNWLRVRPRLGWTIIVRIVPQGDNLRTILSVAVLVAAVALGQYYAFSLAGGLFGASLDAIAYGGATGFASATAVSAVSSAITAGTAIAGSLLVNSLVPVRGANNQDSGTSVYSITGLQNSANPGGVIPSILGTHRYAPPYAATPYTQIVGTEQYVTAAFLAGHGPLTIDNMRLGDTPLASFADVQIENRYGYDGDAPITLYPEQVIEDQLSVEILNANPPTTRFSARDAVSVEIDITFVQGLVRFDDKGNKQGASVSFRIRQRRIGDPNFALVIEFPISGNEQKIVRQAFRWDLPSRGQYEIELSRITSDQSDTKIQDRAAWSAIRSFRPESPFNFIKPVALTVIRIRASSQLNGVVNNFNADYTLLCKDWDIASQSWIVRATSNPASLFRHVLQSSANTFPKTDEQIDLIGLQSWHEYCSTKGITYNRVHDYNASRLDVLADIAAAGRATPHDDGTVWGVVVDRPSSVYVSAVTPRNSWDFQGEVPYVQFPDAHRVKFIDATNGYQQAERIVPFPGVDPESVQVTEELSHPGITDPALIWKETRRRQFELLNRRGTYTFNMDIESLVFARGDLIPLNHDLMDRAHTAARVVDISDRFVTIDTPVTMEAALSYSCSFRLADGSTKRRAVFTAPGETQTLSMTGDLSGISVGDLASFGTVVRGPNIDIIVKSIERGDNLTTKVTAIDAAPQIDALVDADVPPLWDGRVGEVIDLSALIPAIPVFSAIFSDDSNTLIARLVPGDGAVVLPSSYVVSYRAHGSGAYASITIFPLESANITGFTAGAVIDIKAHAVSSNGQSSADTEVQVVALASAPRIDSEITKFDTISISWDHV